MYGKNDKSTIFCRFIHQIAEQSLNFFNVHKYRKLEKKSVEKLNHVQLASF